MVTTLVPVTILERGMDGCMCVTLGEVLRHPSPARAWPQRSGRRRVRHPPTQLSLAAVLTLAAAKPATESRWSAIWSGETPFLKTIMYESGIDSPVTLSGARPLRVSIGVAIMAGRRAKRMAGVRRIVEDTALGVVGVAK